MGQACMSGASLTVSSDLRQSIDGCSQFPRSFALSGFAVFWTPYGLWNKNFRAPCFCRAQSQWYRFLLLLLFLNWRKPQVHKPLNGFPPLNQWFPIFYTIEISGRTYKTKKTPVDQQALPQALGFRTMGNNLHFKWDCCGLQIAVVSTVPFHFLW